MIGEELLDKMELIDPAYVEEAEEAGGKKRRHWIGWGAAAACLTLALLAGTGLLPHADPGPASDLPMLSISETPFGMGSAMGYEGYLAYDISELVNANPWKEDMELSALPVYRNPLTYDENGIVSGGNPNEMEAFLLEVAGRLGLDRERLTVTDDTPDEETRQKIAEKFQSAGEAVPEGYFAPARLIAGADGVEIEVDRAMTATVFFEPPIALPENYDFTYYAGYDDKAAVAGYLKREYRGFIGMDEPQVNISGGDRNYFGQQSYSIAFFDAGGDAARQIINYNFYQAAFYSDDDGKLFLARLFRPNLSEKVGEYPIISWEWAQELLLNGNYITTVPYEIPGAELIKKVELIYRTGEWEEYYMPYYCFYVELPEEERENGLKTYGVYYVPAVEPAYLSNMPVWDGGFNG